MQLQNLGAMKIVQIKESGKKAMGRFFLSTFWQLN